MPSKCNLDECAVIKRYEECEAARIVAQEFGVSDETIYRILRRYNVPRTHRHAKAQKTKFVSNCRSEYCHALIVMLRTVLDMGNSEIARAIGCKQQTVASVICKHGLQRPKPIRAKDLDISAIEREYLNGASSYELGEKYGVNRATISKWMRERGHIRGKGNGAARDKADERKRKEGKRIFEEWLDAKYGDRFTCIEYINNNTPYMLRCNKCGTVFSRWPDKSQVIRCQTCYESDLKKVRAERRQAREQEQQKRIEIERAKVKTCCVCGATFHNEYKVSRYCSDDCKKIAKHKREKERLKRYGYTANHRKRARYYGVAYEPGITTKRLIERDGLTCRICGGICDPNDKTGKHVGLTYPTIDHIVAMKNGGGHTWDNVQIAHMICNSYKRDLTEEELTEEVITHAQKQAAAHKCA